MYYSQDSNLYYNKGQYKQLIKVILYIITGLIIGICAGLYLSMMTIPIDKPNVVYLRSE